MKPLHRFYENRQEANGESMIPVDHQPTDDLRSRIAAAIMESCHGLYLDDAVNAADAVIRELNLAKACEGGCMWQIPNHVEDMTPQQRKILAKDDETE